MSPRGPVVVGVDAGGSKTDVLVVDPDGGVLGSVRGRGANHERHGWPGAAAALEAALSAALAEADASRGAVVASAWGLAGLDWPADEVAYRGLVDGFGLGGPAVVVNDAELVLEGAPEPSAGSGRVAVVSGTGMVVVGRTADGRTARTLGVGGGPGDWGSGGDVVRAAAEAVAAELMGTGPPTTLTGRALRASGAPDARAYCQRVWRDDAPALLPPDVWAAVAEDGDAVAAGITDRVADSLALGAAAVAGRLGLVPDGEPYDVLLSGRVLDPGDPVLHDRLVARLAAHAPAARPRRLGVPPVHGAALAAARLAGWGTDLSGGGPSPGRARARTAGS